MNRSRVRVIVQKEWLDMRKNKMVLLMMFALPILMVAMILGTAWVMARSPGAQGQPSASNGSILPAPLAALGPRDGLMVLLNDQFMFYLFMIPIALPVYIAAYSIIGEKETRSLEPILATPISTTELLLGKIIAAVTPAVLAAWISFAFTAVGMYLITNPVVFSFLVRPVWSVGMLLHSPLFGLLSASCGVIASSRLNDPRAAQQVTGLIVLPILGVSVAVVMGRIYMDSRMLIWATLAAILVNVAVLWLTVKLFQRETILTRWK
jgi:ABC-2 type transport system permease protein